MSTASKKTNKKKSAKAGFPFKACLVVLLGIVVLVAILLWSSLFKAYPVEGKKQMLAIGAGDTYSGFIDRLAKEKQVHFPIILKLYQKFMINDTLKAGVYEIHEGMSVREVMKLISNSENAQMNRILVIEGTTFKQLIDALKNDPLVTHDISNLSYSKILQELGIPYSHPEGLFAPNTYFFAKGESERKILKDLYNRQIKVLDQAWNNRAQNLPYKDKYEALIMASIIEKETSLDRELEQVSGVFVRRLQQGMRLQTDPTVIYGMGDKYQGNITRQDLRTPTAYNTYTINGLPPTPIALPSQKAIEAAMHPDASNNIYFVATGNGGHKFSSNLSDHNRAVQEYLSVIRAKN
ncbi:endolytic transglycosylase MltG [Acinetobacter sp. YH12039]|uniref:endolytic transglycosylase MltG n=1 Tax=Acinetobacter sp. YH12039 TaxID=2601047 RepID=UPI0015D0E5B2|nr:endolytic transglycosylase MltG [Acinetobacter sp. YH12039]